MSNHTPGPWSLTRDERNDRVRNVVGPEEFGHPFVCELPMLNEDAFCRSLCDANARLIAAAPELKQACEAAVKALNGHPLTHLKAIATLIEVLLKVGP